MATERFYQQIEPLDRGRIRYRIHVWSMHCPNGHRDEEGWQLSAHFAATRWRRCVWILTHLPTGRSCGHTATLAEARRMAATIEPLCPWGRQLSTAYYRRLMPIVREATGGWPRPLRRVA